MGIPAALEDVNHICTLLKFTQVSSKAKKCSMSHTSVKVGTSGHLIQGGRITLGDGIEALIQRRFEGRPTLVKEWPTSCKYESALLRR